MTHILFTNSKYCLRETMTLEDFFTLTEMKDGLTALSRVEELVTVMKGEKDVVVKNVGDATRQWTAVASTIASTESKECLDLFAQLDGLWFMNKWLGDAQKFGHDNSGSFVEETITALLKAVEKLQINKEESVSSGIWVTVQNLLHHSSSKIQEEARALFESWQQSTKCVSICEYKISGGSNNESDTLDGKTANESEKLDDVHISEKNCHAAEFSMVDIVQPRNSDNCPPEKVEVQVDREIEVCLAKSDFGKGRDKSPDPQTSALSEFTQENMSSKEGSHLSIVQETASTETHGSPSPKPANVEGKLVAPAHNDYRNDKEMSDPSINLPENLGESCTLKSGTVSSDPIRDAVINSDSSGVISSATVDVRAQASVLNGREDNLGMVNLSSTKVLLTTGQNDTPAASSSTALSDIVHVSGKSENQKSEFTRMEGIEAVKNKERSRKRSSRKKLTTAVCFSKSANASDKKSEMEFDYGIADALEVARQVAQEVEREVADHSQPSCSTSTDVSSPDRFSQPDSPESVRVNSEHGAEFPSGIEVGEGHCTEASSQDRCLNDIKPVNVTISDVLVKDQENSPVAVAAQEPDVNPEKCACDFDLNRDVCSDDMHHPINPVSPSNANVSAPAAATGTSAAPSQNDGTIWWKGSASTGSFRIASPYKVTNHDGAYSVGTTSSSVLSRSRSSLVFDLNVAEGDDKIADQIPGKKSPGPSAPHTGVRSVEKSPGKSERFNLDLNSISDDGDPAPWFYHQTALSTIPDLPSSSLQPATMRNIDLNDKPAFQNEFSDHGSYSGSRAQDFFGRPKSDDSVISIMGTKVEIPRRDLTSQPLSFLNGMALEPQRDTSITRTGGFLSMGPAMAYTHSPVFGYNGMIPGPTMSFSSPVYGSGGIPYLMDTRGSPVVPQFLGPGTVVPQSQQPFFINMNGAPPGLTGPGPSQQSFDLNSGFVMEDNNNNAGGLRQFMPVQARLAEEQLQPCSVSGVGVKRKEPDSSWGAYPFNHKYQQPPWN